MFICYLNNINVLFKSTLHPNNPAIARIGMKMLQSSGIWITPRLEEHRKFRRWVGWTGWGFVILLKISSRKSEFPSNQHRFFSSEILGIQGGDLKQKNYPVFLWGFRGFFFEDVSVPSDVLHCAPIAKQGLTSIIPNYSIISCHDF